MKSFVYRLVPSSNSFQALETPDAMEALRSLFESPRRVGKRWRRFVARFDGEKQRTRPIGDFPSWAGFPLVASARAWEALAPLVSARVEALPLVVRHGGKDLPYFVLHVLDVVDCLDREHAVLDWMPAKGDRDAYVFAIDEYSFVRTKIHGHEMFRIPEKPNEIFCSQQARDTIVASKLRGLRLTEIAL